MEATYLECPAGRDVFARLADTVIVVQGKEFPAHAAILARESQLLAEAFSAQRGAADLGDAGSTEPPAQKRMRLDGRGAAAAGSSTAAAAQAELICLKEPFKDFSAPEVELFLKAVYQPEGLEGLLGEEVTGRQIEKLSGVIRLADFLNATRVLDRIAAALLAALPSNGGDKHAVNWASLLALADNVQHVLPAYYETMLAYTTRLFGKSVVAGEGGKVTPFQQLVAIMEGMELSQHTWRALALNSLAIGRHLVQDNSFRAATQLESYSAKPLTLLPSTGSDCCFEWEWEPPANISMPHFVRTRRVTFSAANCEWEVWVEVPTAATAEDKAVHLCLQPKSDGARVPFRTLGKLSFVIKDTQGAEYKQSAVKQVTDAKRPLTFRFMSVAELQDASKGYLRNGKLHIRVELEGVRVLDA